jgi:HlyD family type I secretion membrane fusion protein
MKANWTNPLKSRLTGMGNAVAAWRAALNARISGLTSIGRSTKPAKPATEKTATAAASPVRQMLDKITGDVTTWRDYFTVKKATPQATANTAKPQADKRRTVSATPTVPLAAELRTWRLAGYGVIVFFIGGGILWSTTTRLDSAAIAHGVVGVESSSKTIQHLEGGIIKAILVENGQHVEAGQPLVKFDDTYAGASLDLLKSQLAGALALHARLIAERDRAPEIVFSDELLTYADDPEIGKIIAGQVDIFDSRRERIANQEKILRERIKKNRSEIVGLKAQIEAGEKQLELLDEEIVTAQALFERGLGKRSRLLALKRKAAEIAGEIGEYKAQIARVGEGISELQLQLTIPENHNLNQVTEQLNAVQERIANLRDKIHASDDVLRRTAVRAPQSGTVVDLQIHTAGGVVQPGERLMSLVPDRDRLVVDLRIDPKDIDAVYLGMPARMRMTAFNARSTAPLEGKVTSVSADRMTDPLTGVSYFSARVVPNEPNGESEVKTVQMASLTPGMQAEVFLVTKQRTVMDYLLEPVTRSFERAGREQ